MPSFDARTALIVVDMQNDFADPQGSLYVDGGHELVTPINELIQRALSQGAFVVYTQDWHPKETPHFKSSGGPWPEHCVKGSWGARFVPELELNGPVVQTGIAGEDGYSGFLVRDLTSGEVHKTALDQMLRERGIERVVVVGIAQDWCVKETALDANRLGYATEVVGSATRPVAAETGQRALAEMTEAGVIIS